MFRCILPIIFALITSMLLLFRWPISFGFLGICWLIWVGFLNPTRLMLIVGVLLVFQPFLGFFRIPYLGQFDEFLLLLSLLCVFSRSLIDRRRMINTPVNLWVVLLLMVGFLSSIVNRFVPLSIALGGALLFCKGFLFFYIFANVPLQTRDINSITKTFLIVGLITAIYGILGAIAPSLFLSPLGIVNQSSYFTMPALQSFLGHPGAFAALMAILGAFTFSRYWITGQKKFLLLNIFFVICMILSFRRTSVTGYFLSVLIVIFAKGMVRPAISINRKLIICGVIALFISFSGVFYKMYHNLHQSYFLMGETPRSLLLQTGVKIATEHFPLGAGFGTYGSGINRSFYSPLFYKYRLFTTWGLSEEKDDFTNDAFWPHVMGETGVMGFILYLIILWILISTTTRMIKTVSNMEWKAFALGTFMMLLVSIMESTKATFYEGTLWTYLYFGGAGICINWITTNSATCEKKAN